MSEEEYDHESCVNQKVKGVWIHRDVCIWKAEVTEMSYREFGERLEEFGDEEDAPQGVCPWITTRYVNGHQVDIWYDENFWSYHPVPSAMATDAVEPLCGMLFITGGEDHTGKSMSLPDGVIADILKTYNVPDPGELGPYAKTWGMGFAFLMMGYKLVHFTCWDPDEDSRTLAEVLEDLVSQDENKEGEQEE